MAVIELKEDKIAELAHVVLFSRKLRLALTYMTEDTEVSVTYQFVVTEREDEVASGSKNSPRKKTKPLVSAAPPPAAVTVSLVFCDNYTCNKEDPFRIFGKLFLSTNEFYDFVTPRKRKERDGFVYNLTTIAIYPREWYECFEKDPAASIAAMEKLVPSILSETRTVMLPRRVPPPGAMAPFGSLASLTSSRVRLNDKRKISQLQNRIMAKSGKGVVSPTIPGPRPGDLNVFGALSIGDGGSDSDEF